jgi:hypothetical protein
MNVVGDLLGKWLGYERLHFSGLRVQPGDQPVGVGCDVPSPLSLRIWHASCCLIRERPPA